MRARVSHLSLLCQPLIGLFSGQLTAAITGLGSNQPNTLAAGGAEGQHLHPSLEGGVRMAFGLVDC